MVKKDVAISVTRSYPPGREARKVVIIVIVAAVIVVQIAAAASCITHKG